MLFNMGESETISIDEFDLDLRLGTIKIGDQTPVEVHASGSCTCSCGRTCTCYSQCTCTCTCGGCDDDATG